MSLARQRLPELMDQADLNPALHRQALQGLSRINWWSLTDNALWHSLQKFCSDNATTPLRVLDVACGGGDVAIRLARRARLQNRKFEVVGVDASETAIDFANEKAAEYGLETAWFLKRDVLEEPLPGSFDVVISTLFLHHLDSQHAVTLLRRMGDAARTAVLVDDLRPTHFGYFLAWSACRLLTRSHIVHSDGPASVQAAYTPSEAIQLAESAGLSGATTTNHWPQRYFLLWRRP